MATKSYPHIPKDLLEYLESLHPDVVPDYTLSNETKCFMAGQVNVVRNIRFHYNKQLNNLLENKSNVHA
jgi:hypothetical protein